MKKVVVGLVALLILTGCQGKEQTQTLFVKDKKDHYGLVDIDGEKMTKFIYDYYEEVGTSGYIVVKDKKYSYLSLNGEEVIKPNKYKKLTPLEGMIVAYDKNDQPIILNGDGKVIAKSDSKTEIILTGLPIVREGKKYQVFFNDGKELISTKKKILSANTLIGGYHAVCFENEMYIYNEAALDYHITVEVGGNNQLMARSKDGDYLLYNRENEEALAVAGDGKVNFKTKIALDDFYFDQNNNITGVKNQTTYLFDQKGTAIAINSYYRNLNDYVIKNQELIYGPHKFVHEGKEITVNNIQLDPLASYSKHKIFPVYVRNKGYMYYGFDGKEAFKKVFDSAEIYDKNNLAVVSEQKDKYYLIDKKGERISKKYHKIINIGNQYYAGYVSGSKYEVFDNKGKKVINDYFMDVGTVFTYNDITYGIFNKSGTSYVYDLKELEIIFSVEDSLEFDDNGYFVSEDGRAFYSLTGDKIYKR